jgi:enoyl-CoA hydratase
MYTTLLTEIQDRILTITINRPDKLNALNQVVMQELQQAVTEAGSNNDVGGIIITGAGPKAFVAGADISEFQSLDTQGAGQLAKKGQDIFFLIENSRKPVIAAVNGFALGGGCELAMSCHFRLASDNARFGQPEVNLGLIPGYGGTQRLTQLVGKGRALELMMTAGIIDAQEACRIGLVNHVIPQDQLIAKAKEILQTILSKAPVAIAELIQSVNKAYEPNGMGYAKEVNSFESCFQSDDVKEGIAAFLEKRKAAFQGK